MSDAQQISDTQYKRNALGHFVPVEQIKDIDLLRDDLVKKIVADALQTQALLRAFKERSLREIDSFIDLSAAEYDAQIGGAKGNVTLTSFDGKYKVKIKVQDTLAFDERLQIAKQMIDDLIHKWTQGSRSEVKALIDGAFQTDKEGKINRGRVLGLFKLKIDDPEWKSAMDALRDSMQISHSKDYLLIYERVGKEGKEQIISLDMAVL